MFLLRGVIDHSLYTNSPLSIIFYDFKQCFDSIWLQDSMICLWNAGMQDELFYLVYKLNEHAKIKVFTPFGETRMFEVDDIIIYIVCKGVPAPHPFLRHPPLDPACPPPFFKFLFPLPSFLFHLLLRYFRQFPHPHTTSSCPNPTNQPSLV